MSYVIKASQGCGLRPAKVWGHATTLEVAERALLESFQKDPDFVALVFDRDPDGHDAADAAVIRKYACDLFTIEREV